MTTKKATTWEEVQENSEIVMAMDARISHLEGISASLVRMECDNSDIIASIELCKKIIKNIKN